MTWRTRLLVAMAAAMILLGVAGCGGASDIDRLTQALQQAQQSLSAWKVWVVVVGLLAFVIGAALGSSARKDADKGGPRGVAG